jgi:hypothetical protein
MIIYESTTNKPSYRSGKPNKEVCGNGDEIADRIANKVYAVPAIIKEDILILYPLINNSIDNKISRMAAVIIINTLL